MQRSPEQSLNGTVFKVAHTLTLRRLSLLLQGENAKKVKFTLLSPEKIVSEPNEFLFYSIWRFLTDRPLPRNSPKISCVARIPSISP